MEFPNRESQTSAQGQPASNIARESLPRPLNNSKKPSFSMRRCFCSRSGASGGGTPIDPRYQLRSRRRDSDKMREQSTPRLLSYPPSSERDGTGAAPRAPVEQGGAIDTWGESEFTRASSPPGRVPSVSTTGSPEPPGRLPRLSEEPPGGPPDHKHNSANYQKGRRTRAEPFRISSSTQAGSKLL